MIKVFILYELNLWSHDLGTDLALGNCLFWAVRLTENVVKDEYGYNGYGIRFHANSSFSLSNCNRFGKNVIIFGIDSSSLVHANHKNKDNQR